VRRLSSGMTRLIHDRRRHVRQLTDRLVHPKRRLDDLRLRLDDLSNRLYGAFQRRLDLQKERLEWRHQRLFNNSPAVLLQARKFELSRLNGQLNAAAHALVQNKALRVKALNAQLSALSPAAVLDRGYSITRRPAEGETNQTIIKDAAAVAIGQRLEILLARGKLICSVEEKQEDGQKKDI
jgi:exodeoxyribonuclease VII large subunit